MSKTSKMKATFRHSKQWRDFRNHIRTKQNGIDPITKRKLAQGANLHHRNLLAEDYTDLSNENDFVMLSSTTHKMLHWLYVYWSKDKSIMQRIEEELNKWHR